jgi:hypothetical protein
MRSEPLGGDVKRYWVVAARIVMKGFSLQYDIKIRLDVPINETWDEALVREKSLIQVRDKACSRDTSWFRQH